jgi:hypothetical protein
VKQDRFTAEVKMRPLTNIIGSVTLSLFVIQTAVLVAAKVINSGDPHDPLAPYVEIMPGQLMEILTPTWCSTYEEYVIEENFIRICHADQIKIPFSSISIYIRDRVIQRLTFQVDGISLGDLARQWGHPIIVLQNYYIKTYYARWVIGDYMITVPIRSRKRFSYWMPVEVLTVEAHQQPDNLLQ